MKPSLSTLCAALVTAFWPLGLGAQGTLDAPVSPALAEARQAWLDGRYDGIWAVVRAEAEAGSPVAQNMLGVGLTEQDGGQGIAYDPAAGLMWYQRAADQGFARAVFNMALFWQNDHAGHGLDYARARALAEQAVAMGYPEAWNILGDLHHHGRGVPEDKAEALAMYRKGADAGTFNGLREVGYAYYHGHGVTPDVDLARLYLERAVAAGDRKSIPDLAWLYEGNDGVAQDLLKSWLLYRLGVERGVARAAYELGLFVAWEDYAGVWHDKVQGYGYCLLAIDWGHSLAEGDIAAECEDLSEGLDPAQRAAARAFAEAQKGR
ncbi:tetratricopeptide repeat protein [Maliponia aquimaris]|uniref:Putative beta-lactamase HcpC n=1 Tax=Maliponia aquimaris TaxID=1673631 RepID=A0A238L040_9RHOB|nr:tetratricopeptide repeat protein [Maliponia aquimaris]SMX48337.1 Putative beta-lactamase HcpC precursor [Maliponia aquimaris]